jgi:hypothetical protein
LHPLQLQPAICSERIIAVRIDQIGLLGQMPHHAVWLSDLLSAKVGKSFDDEGNDLLLNSERGAGGVVVSKEEVAVGRKGSGGAWGSTSRNAGLAAGPAPQNGRIRTLAKKKAKYLIAGLWVAIWWC